MNDQMFLLHSMKKCMTLTDLLQLNAWTKTLNIYTVNSEQYFHLSKCIDFHYLFIYNHSIPIYFQLRYLKVSQYFDQGWFIMVFLCTALYIHLPFLLEFWYTLPEEVAICFHETCCHYYCCQPFYTFIASITPKPFFDNPYRIH